MLNVNTENQPIISAAQASADANSQKSQDWAREQMNFQEQSNAKAMKFSADQAQRNRDWQERMSNTSHQREVQDLLKAGLNPILSAHGGATTPTGSSASGTASQGAKGDVDKGLTDLFSGLLNSVIAQATALQTTSMNNMTALETTNIAKDTAIKTSQIGAGAMLGTANINSMTNLKMQEKEQAFDEFMKKNYPQTPAGMASSIKEQFRDLLNINKNGKSLGDQIMDYKSPFKKWYPKSNGESW